MRRFFCLCSLSVFQSLAAVDEIEDLRCRRDRPREDVEQIQRRDRVEMREDRIHPDHAEHARAHDHDDSWHKAAANAAAGGDGTVHEGADAVGKAHDPHPLHACGDDVRIIREDIQKRLAAEQKRHAQHRRDHERIAEADVIAFHHPVLFPRAPVLTHEGRAGGIERGHDVVNHVVHVDCGGVAGDDG